MDEKKLNESRQQRKKQINHPYATSIIPKEKNQQSAGQHDNAIRNSTPVQYWAAKRDNSSGDPGRRGNRK